MIRRSPNGDLPQIHDTAFVVPTAIVCGKIIVHENVFIGPYAVIAPTRAMIGRVIPNEAGFSESVAQANNGLMMATGAFVTSYNGQPP
jgi:hypothetical protein